MNKSAATEIRATVPQRAESFGSQVGPVVFLAPFFFVLISAGYLSGLLGSGFLSSRTTHRQTILVSAAGVGVALLVLSASSSLWATRSCLRSAS